MLEQNPEKNNKPIVVLIIVVIVIVLAAVGYFLIPSTEKSSNSLSSPRTSVDSGGSSQTGTVSKSAPQRPQVKGRVYLEAVADASLGEEVGVVVRIDTGGKNITLTKIALEYNPQVLQWQSIDGSGSVLPMQFKKEDSNGKIVISRGATGDADWQDSDDGFTGFDGLFARVVFKAVAAGSTELRLVPGETRMFLDDGRATEVQLELQGTSFTIE